MAKVDYAKEGKISGEDLAERLSRFSLISQNEYGNWDLSNRDINALRTVEAMMVELKDEIIRLRKKIATLED